MNDTSLAIESNSKADFTVTTSSVSRVSQSLSPRQIQQNPANPAEIFSKEFSRLQEQQITFLRKLEKERKRKETIDAKLLDAKVELRSLLEKTKGGSITKEIDIFHQRQIGKVENNLQLAKVKLSVARNENASLKKKIDNLRKEKLLHVQIMNDMVREMNETKDKIKNFQKEILQINEAKHKVKIHLSSAKNKMLLDMEDFTNKLNNAKQSISETQAAMLGTIREKMQMTNEIASTISNSSMAGGKRDSLSPRATRTTVHSSTLGDYTPRGTISRQSEVAEILAETGHASVEELLQALQQSEEAMFSLYNETQLKNEEMEKLQSENKRLETEIQQQLKELSSLELRNEEKKEELEKSILALKTSISKYDSDYNHNMDLLSSISEMLMNLLRNLAVEEAQLDQQLLSTGITDRNIEAFLGLVEQRIDDLIQMSKAAHRQVIKRDDFMRMAVAGDKMSGFQAPSLPTVADSFDEDLDDMEDNNGKIQPINIAALKEMMNKKVQKIAIMKPKVPTGAGAPASLGSRQSSKRSIKSNVSSDGIL